jgi:hypothetical protein
VQHREAAVADFEVDAQGEDYVAHLYQTDIALPATPGVAVDNHHADRPGVLVEVNGPPLSTRSGTSASVDLANRAGSPNQRPRDQNANALPARIPTEDTSLLPRGCPDLTATQPGRQPRM